MMNGIEHAQKKYKDHIDAILRRLDDAHKAEGHVTNAPPEEAALFVAALVDSCSSQEDLFYVAAGPLEDLFSRKDLEAAYSQLEIFFRQQRKMRGALAGVWVFKGNPNAAFFEKLVTLYKNDMSAVESLFDQ